MHSFKAAAPGALLAFLAGRFPEAPRTRLKKWLRLRCVSVNGQTVTRHDHALSAGDRILVEPGKKSPELGGSPLKTVFEDADILVVDKPSGLLTVATETEKTKTAYFELNRWGRVFIVHRLDRDTSGLLVFAKNEAAKYRLQDTWDGAEKLYAAVVEGVPKKKEDTLRSRLAQSKGMKVYSTEDDRRAKEAVTLYKVVRENGDYALLDVSLETGRKNQIRVQLADIGHPVAGDEKYGAKTDPAGRLALHARHLSFDHPVTGKRLAFESPIPPEIARIVR